jgi:hypothetical protein
LKVTCLRGTGTGVGVVESEADTSVLPYAARGTTTAGAAEVAQAARRRIAKMALTTPITDDPTRPFVDVFPQNLFGSFGHIRPARATHACERWKTARPIDILPNRVSRYGREGPVTFACELSQTCFQFIV